MSATAELLLVAALIGCWLAKEYLVPRVVDWMWEYLERREARQTQAHKEMR